LKENTMNTVSNTRSARRVAATLAAAGAIAAGALASGATANASVDYYLALSYSLGSDIGGAAYNMTDPSLANSLALQDCEHKGGRQCVVYVNVKNTCAAFAVFGTKESSFATASDDRTARVLATKQNPGSHIGVSGCSTGSPVHYDPSNPPPRSAS
jgi:Domain of unknown function (DUF4189)